jgi:Ca-activated chloride channel family protein
MKITSLFWAILFSITAFGQTDKIKGQLAAIDSTKVSVLNIFPGTFPNVSVVFKTENPKGKPVWGLTKDMMRIKENQQDCQVLSVEPISKNKPINLGIVVDCSGSMRFPENLTEKPESTNQAIYHAKSAVKTFIKTFNTQKDWLSIVGFSTVPNDTLPLTQNLRELTTYVDLFRASGSTALYDGIITGLNETKKGKGIKVLVVLTDGDDNSSYSSLKDVVKLAQKEEIPIYMIELGNVNDKILTEIADSTKGKFFKVESAESLNEVYAEISEQIQSFYELVYHSPNVALTDNDRQVELFFDTAVYKDLANNKSLPAEVSDFMSLKDAEKQHLILGGIVLVILVTAGVLLIKHQRKATENKQTQPYIQKLYPNPTDGFINLEYVSEDGQLQILDYNGQVLKTWPINGTETNFDVTTLPDGNYLALIQTNGQTSNTVKFVVKR